MNNFSIYFSLFTLIIIAILFYLIFNSKNKNKNENFTDCLTVCNNINSSIPYEICKCAECCQNSGNASDICINYHDFFSIYNCSN